LTLLPSDSWEIEGVSGDRYQVPVRCQAPGCQRYSDHLHHLWRRSFLGGDYWWVRLPGGLVVRNIVGLCIPHHEDVTGKPGAGHVAWIRWIPGTQEFRWMEEESTSGKWRQVGTLSLPAPIKTASDGTPGREAERCPVCGKLKRQTVEHEHEPGPKRPRKSWTIQVPADEEDGATVLDELVEGCAEVFGHDEYTSKLRRYFTVVAALTVVLQNRELIQVEIEP
jgi:hypothetical protein